MEDDLKESNVEFINTHWFDIQTKFKIKLRGPTYRRHMLEKKFPPNFCSHSVTTFLLKFHNKMDLDVCWVE